MNTFMKSGGDYHQTYFLAFFLNTIRKRNPDYAGKKAEEGEDRLYHPVFRPTCNYFRILPKQGFDRSTLTKGGNFCLLCFKPDNGYSPERIYKSRQVPAGCSVA